jgi:hypothetical protein
LLTTDPKTDKLTNMNSTTKLFQDPGPGYRLLKPGEIIEESDQVYYISTGKWMPVTKGIGQAFGSQGLSFLPRRRRVLPDPGPGYRLLEKGEAIRKSDEFWVGGAWNLEVHSAEGKTFGGHGYFLPRRRKMTPEIDPGEGYRLLQDGEIIKPGDKILSVTGGWWPCTATLGQCVAYGFTIRRPVPEMDGSFCRGVQEPKEPSLMPQKEWIALRVDALRVAIATKLNAMEEVPTEWYVEFFEKVNQ